MDNQPKPDHPGAVAFYNCNSRHADVLEQAARDMLVRAEAGFVYAYSQYDGAGLPSPIELRGPYCGNHSNVANNGITMIYDKRANENVDREGDEAWLLHGNNIRGDLNSYTIRLGNNLLDAWMQTLRLNKQNELQRKLNNDPEYEYVSPSVVVRERRRNDPITGYNR